ncbi:MAG: tetratricopeptide repeat protein [Deltaproteobacteria bacterium]|nr:tetratricopeptide repeat protein [Deltaproteobacteria bacterium]
MKWIIASIVCGLSITSIGCGHGASQVQLHQLREKVQLLQAQVGRYDTQITDLQNQVFLIIDQQKRERADAEARQPPPHLRVVKLAPAKAKRNSQAAPADNASDVINIEMTGEPPESPTETLSVAKVPPPTDFAEETISDAESMFRDALRTFREGRTGEATKLFSQFVERYPKHIHADKALYWMGESSFESGAFSAAVQHFNKLLLRYPRSGKIAEALFRMGVAYERLGSDQQAQQAFLDLVTNYPNTALADLARNRLQNKTRNER